MYETPYCYYATVDRVVDGDTVVLIIDEGFKHSWKVSCRLAGINAPELKSKVDGVAEKGQAAREYLEGRLAVGEQVYIVSRVLDKYGRPIVDLYYKGEHVNAELLEKGFAVKYGASSF